MTNNSGDFILCFIIIIEVPNANFTAGTVVVLSRGPRPGTAESQDQRVHA